MGGEGLPRDLDRGFRIPFRGFGLFRAFSKETLGCEGKAPGEPMTVT